MATKPRKSGERKIANLSADFLPEDKTGLIRGGLKKLPGKRVPPTVTLKRGKSVHDEP